MATEKNSIDHWYLYSLAKYEEVHDEGARSRELFEYTNNIFDNAQIVSNAGSRCHNEKGVVDRVDENDDDSGPVRYRYWLNDEGIRVLRHLSIPDELPNGTEIHENAREAMGMPDFVEETELEHPEPEESKTETKSTGRFSSPEQRRRWFARQDDEEYLEWLEEEWAEQHRIDQEGEVSYEGVEQAIGDFLGREEKSTEVGEVQVESDEPSEDIELEEFERGVPLEEETEEIDLEDFDPVISKPSENGDMPDEVNVEPNWEWYAAELLKRGLPGLAAKALNKEYSPMDMMYDIDTILRKIDIVSEDVKGVEIAEDTIYEFFDAFDEEGNRIEVHE